MLADSPRFVAPDPAGFPALAAGQLHEIHGGRDDWASVLGFALAMVSGRNGAIVLARGRGGRRRLFGEGLEGLRIDRSRLLLIEAEDERALLRAGLDAARCPGLGAVVLDTKGALPAYTLTASRQLVLAAERAGAPVILLRADATPRASAAHTRWQIAPAPSRGEAGWTIEATLLRRRGGPAGMRWLLEWNEDDGQLRPVIAEAGAEPALSGAVVPLAGGGAGARRAA